MFFVVPSVLNLPPFPVHHALEPRSFLLANPPRRQRTGEERKEEQRLEKKQHVPTNPRTARSGKKAENRQKAGDLDSNFNAGAPQSQEGSKHPPNGCCPMPTAESLTRPLKPPFLGEAS